MAEEETVGRADAGPTAEFLGAIGERIRRRRTGAGWTVQELADRAGISRRMLTQIELGQANPSLVTVDKIARAVGTDFAALAAPAAAGPLAVHSADTGRRVWTSPAGGEAVLHQSTVGRSPAELWEWTLAVGDRYDAQPDPVGSWELFLVVAGCLTIELGDGASEDVPAGSSAALATDREYAYVNNSGEAVRFIRVVQLGA